MKYQYLIRSVILLLALPFGWFLTCLFLDVCSIETILFYQWPAYLSCYIPAFSHLFLDSISKRIDFSNQERLEAVLSVAPLLFGPLLRLGTIVIVAFYWLSFDNFKPIYSFLIYVIAYLAFQLASLAIVKK